MTRAWAAIRFGFVAVGRFAVRMALDNEGKPSTVRILIWPWMAFAGALYWRALEVQKAAPVALETVVSVTLISLALILWAAATKLGVGVFVPLAEAIGGIVSRVGTGLRKTVASYGGGPSRNVAVLGPGGELQRESPPTDPRQPNPYLDDERDE